MHRPGVRRDALGRCAARTRARRRRGGPLALGGLAHPGPLRARRRARPLRGPRRPLVRRHAHAPRAARRGAGAPRRHLLLRSRRAPAPAPRRQLRARASRADGRPLPPPPRAGRRIGPQNGPLGAPVFPARRRRVVPLPPPEWGEAARGAAESARGAAEHVRGAWPPEERLPADTPQPRVHRRAAGKKHDPLLPYGGRIEFPWDEDAHLRGRDVRPWRYKAVHGGTLLRRIPCKVRSPLRRAAPRAASRSAPA